MSTPLFQQEKLGLTYQNCLLLINYFRLLIKVKFCGFLDSLTDLAMVRAAFLLLFFLNFTHFKYTTIYLNTNRLRHAL